MFVGIRYTWMITPFCEEALGGGGIGWHWVHLLMPIFYTTLFIYTTPGG